MTAQFGGLSDLQRAVSVLGAAEAPAEVFRALVEGSGVGAPRAVLFLLREPHWKGWASRGYPAAISASARKLVLPANAGWLTDAASDRSSTWRTAVFGDPTPSFGQPPADEVVGLPLQVGAKTVAVLVAERGFAEEPWHPDALAILIQAARMRLELDLAWRRLRGGAPASGSEAGERSAVVPASPPQPAARPHDSSPPTPSSASAPRDLAPWEEPETHGPGADAAAEEARRFARLVATDIRLYNEEAVLAGRRERNLVERLGEQIDRGRESFLRRFPELGDSGDRILQEPFVQVLAGGDESLLADR